jgi:hypothetical protein
MLSLGTVPMRCDRWLVERGYNNCTVPGLSIPPCGEGLSHKTQSKKRRLALWSTYSRCNFINTACMVAKIGSVPRDTLPNRPPKSIRKQRTKRLKTTGYRSKIRILQVIEKFSCTRIHHIHRVCTHVIRHVYIRVPVHTYIHTYIPVHVYTCHVCVLHTTYYILHT